MLTGNTIHGFTVLHTRPVRELGGTLYELRHGRTGLEAVWLSRPEENRTFGIAFQTLPEDDTGVFHILEHSVLCGSERYPLREPFVELMKTSMNTFLNAMTFPDKTYYPISSRNARLHKSDARLPRRGLQSAHLFASGNLPAGGLALRARERRPHAEGRRVQ